MTADDEEFTAWYESERDSLVSALALVTGEVDAAADAVAEAFTKAYSRWGRVGRMESRTGWIYRTALNVLRRRARRRALEARLLRRARSAHTPPSEPSGEIWAAVALLPVRQREAIVLRYVADLTEREVAAVMGTSEGAASASLTAARRSLAERLSKPEGVPRP